jgi:hypothetical protein
MSRGSNFIALMALLILGIGCLESSDSIESISMDFPHGETRLLVQRDGEAFLFYGALPSHQKIGKGTFDLDKLYKQLKSHLHENVPREKWPNPKSKAGMVTIRFQNKSQKDYLIFDEDLAKLILDKARQNIAGRMP